MNRLLLQILKFALIAAGVVVVLWSITWQDSIRIPAGSQAPDGSVAQVSRDYPVENLRSDSKLEPSVVHGVVIFPGADTSLDSEVTFPREWYRPGILTTFSGALLGLLLLGLIPLAGVYPLQATRWWLLMRCRGLKVSWIKTLRLVFVGAFFNFCLPGTEGGDVVKAWYVARRSDRRVVAVMSVVFDRLTGLLGLIVLAAVAGLLATRDSTANLIGWWSLAAIVMIMILAWLYFSVGLRSWLRLDRLQNLFGGGLLSKVEEAIHAYGQHKGAVLIAIGLSIGVQTLLAFAATTAGVSLGIGHDPWVIMAIMPVLFLAAAIPMTWQGVGVMEGLGILLLAAPGLATPNEVIGMLLIYRGYELAWSLCGSLLLLKGDIHLHPERYPESQGGIEGDSSTMGAS